MTGPSPWPTRVVRPGLLVAATLALAGLGVATWSPSPAAAHAALLSSTPTDGGQPDSAPTEVELTFNENVSAALGAIRVLDAEGERVDGGDIENAGQRVTVALGDLDDGAYIVAWRVVSADSHPIKGSFTFSVGDDAAGIDDSLARTLLGGADDGPWKAAGTASRFLAYGGSLLAVGSAVFGAFVHDGGPEVGRLRRLVRVGAGIGAVGVVAELPIRAALATGLGPDSLTAPGVLGQLLADQVGIAMAISLLALLFVTVDGGRDRLVAGACTAAVGVSLAIAGHTATTSPVALGIASDAVHTSAAAVWFGGLVGGLVVVVARWRQTGTWAAVVVRFSGVAGVALASVAVAGGALGWVQVGSFDALLTTAYGQLLIAKVLVVGLVASLGAVNRYRLVPLLDAPTTSVETADANRVTVAAGAVPLDPPTERLPETQRSAAEDVPRPNGEVTGILRRTLAVEVALLVLVVGITSVLVDVTPARASVAAPFVGSEPLGEGTMEIDVDPTRAGRTTIHLYAYDETGQVLPADEVTLRFSLPSSDVSNLERTPEPTGPGHWTHIGDDFSIAGTWTVEVVARTSVYDEEIARFEVPIKP